jgi:hypothetical protein
VTAFEESFVRGGQTADLAEKRLANFLLNGVNYNLAPDGKRIAVLMPAEASQAQQAQNHVIFLQNFFDELRRKAPASK